MSIFRVCLKPVVVGVVLLIVSPFVAHAAEADTQDWQFGVMLYGWLPSVTGDLSYSLPPGSGGDSVSVDAGDILDALQMTFMASFEARKGPWLGYTDLIYLDLAGDKSRSTSLTSGATRELFDADLELTGWLWTVAGGYTAWRKEGSHLDLLAGLRLLSLETDVKLTGSGPLQRELKLSESQDLWDGIVGVKGRLAIADHWFLPYYADVGTGDTELTWQVAAGIAYAFRWGDVSLMYRYLQYDQGGDKLLQDLAFGGGMLGVTFRF